MLYRTLLRPLLYRLPAERAHHLGFGALRLACAVPGVRALLRAWLAPRSPALAVPALGQVFPSPVGLAAGFDKDAVGFEAIGALGFGFVEVGTLTARAQPGNPKPRLFRLQADEALLNRLGFNNGGAAAAVPRLARPRRTLVGVNVGKSKVAEEAEALADYAESTALLAPYADYFVVNVSSPNTPGLRDLQAVAKLEPLLRVVRATIDRVRGERGQPHLPLLVKIAPDLSDEDVDAVADLALTLGLDGIVATNTTISRAGLRTDAATVQALGAGGISGRPVAARALAVLRRLRARVGDRLTLIAVGGIADADEAWARIRAGATLLQLYTGFVYEGPFVARDIARGLLERARAAGFESVAAAIGCDAAANPAE